jgi:hypothetical protein
MDRMCVHMYIAVSAHMSMIEMSGRTSMSIYIYTMSFKKIKSNRKKLQHPYPKAMHSFFQRHAYNAC